MFGMSLPELILIMTLGLIIFGPEKVPKVARKLGAFVREARQAAAEVQRTMDVELLREELRTKNRDRHVDTPPVAPMRSNQITPPTHTSTSLLEQRFRQHLQRSQPHSRGVALPPQAPPSAEATATLPCAPALRPDPTATRHLPLPRAIPPWVRSRHVPLPPRRPPQHPATFGVPLAAPTAPLPHAVTTEALTPTRPT